MKRMLATVATILVLTLTAVVFSGCATRIDLADFTVPELIENYDGDWQYYKKRGVKPNDYVMATVIEDAVITATELGKAGDFYIVEEDGRVDIMGPETFKQAYVRVK